MKCGSSLERIGPYTEVIEANLRLKLLESNRHLQDTISVEQARQGAEALAAATYFHRTELYSAAGQS